MAKIHRHLSNIDRVMAFLCHLALLGITVLKGKYHAILLSFQNPKCLSVNRNKEIIVKFVINYHPSAIKLLISASGQRQSRSVWIET